MERKEKQKKILMITRSDDVDGILCYFILKRAFPNRKIVHIKIYDNYIPYENIFLDLVNRYNNFIGYDKIFFIGIYFKDINIYLNNLNKLYIHPLYLEPIKLYFINNSFTFEEFIDKYDDEINYNKDNIFIKNEVFDKDDDKFNFATLSLNLIYFLEDLNIYKFDDEGYDFNLIYTAKMIQSRQYGTIIDNLNYEEHYRIDHIPNELCFIFNNFELPLFDLMIDEKYSRRTMKMLNRQIKENNFFVLTNERMFNIGHKLLSKKAKEFYYKFYLREYKMDINTEPALVLFSKNTYLNASEVFYQYKFLSENTASVDIVICFNNEYMEVYSAYEIDLLEDVFSSLINNNAIRIVNVIDYNHIYFRKYRDDCIIEDNLFI